MISEENHLHFSEKELKLLEEDVDTIYQKILNNSFKRFVISNGYKIITYFLLVLGFITIVTDILLLVISKINIARNTYFLLIILAIILIVVGTILLVIRQFFTKKMQSAFLTCNIKYLKMAVNSAFTNVEITNVLDNFTIRPEKFLVFGQSYNHRVWTEKVINGVANGKEFNCGTMIEKIVTTTTDSNNNKTTDTTYNRYLYFTARLEPQDVVTTIVPETWWTKLKGSNRGDQLESAEFEKLFALDYSDPIKLRKLLVPKVMNNMLNLAAKQSPLPNIYLSQKQITLMFPYKNISSPDSSTANLINLIISSDEEKLVNNVIMMLNETLHIVTACYDWLVSLDLSEPLLLKK